MSLGEAYMDGWWDCDKLDEFFYKILPGGLDKKVRDWKILIQHIRTSLLNPQRKSKAFHIGEHHYDMGNELYKSMLDKRLTYTCACWKDTKTLDQAQEAKLDLVARKIGLKEGESHPATTISRSCVRLSREKETPSRLSARSWKRVSTSGKM